MGGADYLEGLPPGQASGLTRVNEPGLTALRGYLADGAAVAFLGAGVSRPLYPLWTELIGELVSSASSRLTDEEAATCLMLARESPEEVVDGADRYAAEAIAIMAPRGWAAKADALHKRLVPPGLDPDPLATVERLVAEQAKEKKR